MNNIMFVGFSLLFWIMNIINLYDIGWASLYYILYGETFSSLLPVYNKGVAPIKIFFSN